ncbi:MAG: GNAT family N-acetyltransferase [Acidobacteriaceae bacterium]
MTFEVRELQAEDVARIATTEGGAAWNGGAEKWNQRLADHGDGKRIVLVAANGDEILGYGSLLWSSGHAPFREAGIPELNDVVVAEQGRNHGVGTRIIHALEERARTANYKKIGVGVGLFSDYGAAQRLYIHLGYVPDGEGISSGSLRVAAGQTVRVDDALVLWLVKPLEGPSR